MHKYRENRSKQMRIYGELRKEIEMFRCEEETERKRESGNFKF